MNESVAWIGGRSFGRVALTGLALIWLAGCSTDTTRFAQSDNPFSSPFSNPFATAQSAPAAAWT